MRISCKIDCTLTIEIKWLESILDGKNQFYMTISYRIDSTWSDYV
jgi:hypothetical protein